MASLADRANKTIETLTGTSLGLSTEKKDLPDAQNQDPAAVKKKTFMDHWLKTFMG